MKTKERRKKRIERGLLSLLMIITLTACKAESVDTQTDMERVRDIQKVEEQGLEFLPEVLRDVVFNNHIFLDVKQKKECTMSTYEVPDGEDKMVPAIWKDYIVRDIDMDGERELIVHVNQQNKPDSDLESVCIFDVQLDIVYCYSYRYQAVTNVFQDGAIEGRGEDDAVCIYGLECAGANAEIIRICECDTQKGREKYYIGVRKVTEEEYNQFAKKYEASYCLKWSKDYIDDAIKK